MLSSLKNRRKGNPFFLPDNYLAHKKVAEALTPATLFCVRAFPPSRDYSATRTNFYNILLIYLVCSLSRATWPCAAAREETKLFISI